MAENNNPKMNKKPPPQMAQHMGGHRNKPETARPRATFAKVLGAMSDRELAELAEKAMAAAETGELDGDNIMGGHTPSGPSGGAGGVT